MMSIEETHEWAKKIRSEWDDKVQSGDPIVSHLDKEMAEVGKSEVGAVSFARTERPSFVGEVGRVGEDLFFHFWPTSDDRYSVLTYVGNARDEYTKEKDVENHIYVFSDVFADALATSFLEIFKFEDRMCWDFVPEMNSWVVRVSRFADSPAAEDLSSQLFDSLQRRLEK